jgi:HlyD family secretion protein
MSKKFLLGAFLLAAGVAGFFGYKYWEGLQTALPPGIASGNGRVEAKQVDVAAKESLRIKEILVKEGDLVQAGQVVVRMDTATLESQLVEAKANVAASRERVAAANSAIVKQKSLVEQAKTEKDRADKLLAENAVSQQEYQARLTAVDASIATLAEVEAKMKTAEQEVEVAQANVATIQTRIDDAVLVSPVRGRVIYRLAELGEVLSAGGKALTLINLEDVYMEIFLPSEIAAKLKMGAEARLTVDFSPGKAAAGFVSFVSPEAQFTPKQVETKDERDKLMFRVKIQVPEEFVSSRIEIIKTGIRGVGYVRTDDSAVWPEWLQNVVDAKPTTPTNPESASTETADQQASEPVMVPPATETAADEKATEAK